MSNHMAFRRSGAFPSAALVVRIRREVRRHPRRGERAAQCGPRSLAVIPRDGPKTTWILSSLVKDANNLGTMYFGFFGEWKHEPNKNQSSFFLFFCILVRYLTQPNAVNTFLY